MFAAYYAVAGAGWDLYSFFMTWVERGWHAAWDGGVTLKANFGGQMLFSDQTRAVAGRWSHGLPLTVMFLCFFAALAAAYGVAFRLVLLAARGAGNRLLPKLRAVASPDAIRDAANAGKERTDPLVVKIFMAVVALVAAGLIGGALVSWMLRPVFDIDATVGHISGRLVRIMLFPLVTIVDWAVFLALFVAFMKLLFRLVDRAFAVRAKERAGEADPPARME